MIRASESVLTAPLILALLALFCVGVLFDFPAHAQRVAKRHDRPEIPVKDGEVRRAVLDNEEIIRVDLAKLGVEAGSDSLDQPAAAGVAQGAQLSLAPEVAQPSTTSAVVGATSGWIPSETVTISAGGVTVVTAAADANGNLRFALSTGASTGRLLVLAVGSTSQKRVGGVVEIAPTGPYPTGLAGGPHAINSTAAGAMVTFVGARFPAGATATIKGNGTAFATATVQSDGLVSFSVLESGTTGTAVVYSAEVLATPGSMAGISIELRSDAGTSPVGDQNPVRGFISRAVVSQTTGGYINVGGEGFQPGEVVNVNPLCGGYTFNADSNGAVGFVTRYDPPIPNPALNVCTMTGGTSGRVARAAVLFASNASNSRTMLVTPPLTPKAGYGYVLGVVTGMPANDAGSLYLDGVLLGGVTTNAGGWGNVLIPKPASGFLHGVEWVTSTGVRTAGTLMMASFSVSGRVVTPAGRGIRGATVTVTGATLSAPIVVHTRNYGRYSIQNLLPGNYTLTFAGRRFTFTPNTRNVSSSDTDVTVPNVISN